MKPEDDRKALERIARVLDTAQVRWEGDTVTAYISAIVTAALARPAVTPEEQRATDLLRRIQRDIWNAPGDKSHIADHVALWREVDAYLDGLRQPQSHSHSEEKP